VKLIVVLLLRLVLLGNWIVYCSRVLLLSTVTLWFLVVVCIVTTNHNYDHDHLVQFHTILYYVQYTILCVLIIDIDVSFSLSLSLCVTVL
jgi:hypothetical protein